MTKKWLYKFSNGVHEIREVIPHTRGNTRLMHRAHFIIDLDSGEVIKDRFAGSAGHIIDNDNLHLY